MAYRYVPQGSLPSSGSSSRHVNLLQVVRLCMSLHELWVTV